MGCLAYTGYAWVCLYQRETGQILAHNKA
jgi:hypothetical protein